MSKEAKLKIKGKDSAVIAAGLRDLLINKNEQEQKQSVVIDAAGGSVSPRHREVDPMRVSFEVTQRFYQFQNATSTLKNFGHDPTADFTALLNYFMSFIDPNFVSYRFVTVGTEFDFPTLAAIRAAYTFYAQVLFNAFSQHFSTDPVVTIVPNSNGKQALMISGGGEWANIFSDLTTTPPSAPVTQTTITSWVIIWVFKNGNWYINDYTEYGDQLYRLIPPTGPYELTYQRQYPGAAPTPLASSSAAVTKVAALRDFLKKNLGPLCRQGLKV